MSHVVPQHVAERSVGFAGRPQHVRVIAIGEDPPTPLVDRLGKNFFRQLPERPAVYLLCGPDAGVLYVGRAKNLRSRLSSYRVANPERLPRRIIRLLHRVTRIEYDECANESAACELEKLLICVLAPPFNRAGKVWPFAKDRTSHRQQYLFHCDALQPVRNDVAVGVLV